MGKLDEVSGKQRLWVRNQAESNISNEREPYKDGNSKLPAELAQRISVGSEQVQVNLHLGNEELWRIDKH